MNTLVLVLVGFCSLALFVLLDGRMPWKIA
jgi:hypothetical protein